MSFPLFFLVFIVDLLRFVATSPQVIVSSMVSFFVGFCVDSSNDKVSIRQSHHIKSCLSICCIFEILTISCIFFRLLICRP